MKKILMAVGLVALLAAGCNGAKPAAQNPGNLPAAEAPAGQTATPPAVQAQSNVKVENVDDALNQLDKQAQSEQSITAGTDDSDLTTSDAAELNSYTEVPNGN
ncbi:MAG: hypothetical protein M1333_03430 [Patescibacteria group bacterium]|nr:hypothetical protein [Patescibacteria group bacterium]